MKVLKELDLTAEAAQLRRVMALKDGRDKRYRQELDRLHLMLARKTLEYYGDGGYDAFFERHHFDYPTEDGYLVEVRGHDMSVVKETPYGVITGTGSTWDYTPGDLRVSARPEGLDRKEYEAVKKRMAELEDNERIAYPFHPLHRLGNGYFDTKVCMYGAHKLVKEFDDTAAL
jgi:hypothetical protein